MNPPDRFRDGLFLTSLGFFLISAFAVANETAVSVREAFANTSVNERLDSFGAYTFGVNSTPVGVARRISGTRQYIAAKPADYITVDFSIEVTVMIPTEGTQVAFVGIGSALPDPAYSHEPHTAAYIRVGPDGYGTGAAYLVESNSAGSTRTENALSTAPHPGSGLHRLRISKVGTAITFACDADYGNGSFSPNFTVTRDIADLPWLNNGNTKLFVGADPDVLIDDLQISVAGRPEGDSDGDGIPDSWELAYGLDPYWPNGVLSTGRDGTLNVPTGATVFTDAVRGVVVGNNPAGSTTLQFQPVAGTITAGDLILIHTTQDPNPDLSANRAGSYQSARVAQMVGTTITLSSPLLEAFDASSGAKIQVIKLPEYATATIQGTLACRAWDGQTGGILAFFCDTLLVEVGGRISASGTGFRGGPPLNGQGLQTGIQGESMRGLGTESKARNHGGGGGGDYQHGGDDNGGGGGGGGHGGNGSDGIRAVFGAPPNPEGGATYGNTDLAHLSFGSGGGSGGSGRANQGTGRGAGGTGGGAILIVSRRADMRGRIESSGSAADGSPINERGGGGGGAGGAIHFLGRGTDSGILNAAGGLGGVAPLSGGAGGVGRIRIDGLTRLPCSAVTPLPIEGDLVASVNRFITSSADFDGDGVSDFAEFQRNSDPTFSDTDNDGLPNAWEIENELDPNAPDAWEDFDRDGILNFMEFRAGLKANRLDSDSDGVPDSVEFGGPDGDGMPDAWETQYGLSPAINDAAADLDGDGLSNLLEFWLETNPGDTDTDDDGVSDFTEYNSRGSDTRRTDTDRDGLPDAWETANGTNPFVADQNGDPDSDGLTNAEEFAGNSKPLDPDSDDDGVSDYEERHGVKFDSHFYDRLDRLVASSYDEGAWEGWQYDGNGNILRHILRPARDADSDGLPDAWEFGQGLMFDAGGGTGVNGFGGDLDADGWTNYQEFLAGTAAGDPGSQPPAGGQMGAVWSNPPKARIVFPPVNGSAFASLAFKLWDAEGNPATPRLQYFDPATGQWRDAQITRLNGSPVSSPFAVAAAPGGSAHTLVWNAYAAFGTANPYFTGDVLLRARALDFQSTGAWSEPVPFQVDLNFDSDGDGLPDGWEMQNGFDPFIAAGAGDTDFDSRSDFLEFALGTNPRINSRVGEPVTTMEGGYLTLTVTRNPAASALQFRVAVSGNLHAWFSDAAHVTIIEDTPTLLKARDNVPVGDEPQRFIRLEVNKP